MSVREYIGARYVPLFADPIQWDNTKTYEPLTIVYHQGNSYTSRQAVPTGVAITNDEYWALTGNYNAQIEAYRTEVSEYAQQVSSFDGRIDGLEDALPSSAFDSTHTVDGRFDDIEANGWVTTNRIADSNVTTAKIADSNVTTAKIADSNVTTSKVADGAVTESKIASAYRNQLELIKTDIVALGDSLSTYSYNEGVVSSGAELWEKVALYTGLTVHNFAEGGSAFYNTTYTNHTISYQLDQAIADTSINVNKVKCVFVFAGTNDYGSVSVENLQTAIRNLQAAYQASRFASVPLIIMFNKAGRSINNYSPMISEAIFAGKVTASGCNVSYYNGHSILAGYNSLASDGVHPNTQGFNMLARAVVAAINGGNPLPPSSVMQSTVTLPTGVTIENKNIILDNGWLKGTVTVKIAGGQTVNSDPHQLFKLTNCGAAADIIKDGLPWCISSGANNDLLLGNNHYIGFYCEKDSTTGELIVSFQTAGWGSTGLSRNLYINFYIDAPL